MDDNIADLAKQIIENQEAIEAQLGETNARLAIVDENAVKSQDYEGDKRSLARRNLASFLIAVLAVVLVGYIFWDRGQERATNADRRVTRSSQLYANCQEDNGQNEAAGKTYENLFIAAAAAPPNPNSPLTPAERLENLSRSLDILRGQLTVADCETVLADLTPEQAAKAKSLAAAIPRQPLPPPTVPGYVPGR